MPVSPGGFQRPSSTSAAFKDQITLWVKKAFRDYYKPKLKRELQRDPTPEEMDRRFDEIYRQIRMTLLVGVFEGVGLYFYEIARFTREEFDTFRDRVEDYLGGRFGGGNYKLNFYEGESFIVTVNYKVAGDPRWQHLLPERK
jgi:hypothetical protein